jgi:cell wall-associated NlpC family hydrolase
MMCLHYAPFRALLPGMACCLSLALTSALADPPTTSNNRTTAATTEVNASPPSELKSTQPAGGSISSGESRSGPANRGEQIARTALAFRGARYRHGGVSSITGFDCSGFVQAVCAKWGVYLPRVASEQLTKSRGRRVLPSELQPGDLVFFSDTYKHGTSHVGIYVGAKKMIHAATPSQGVIVSDLTEAYLRNHYCGAIRLDLSKLPPAKPHCAKTQSGGMAGAGISTATP